MTRRFKVGVVGAGVGINHITAFQELAGALFGGGALRHQRGAGKRDRRQIQYPALGRRSTTSF